MKPFATIILLASSLFLQAQATFTDDFSKTHDYITDGVAGTMWDGIYLGAHELMSSMGAGLAEGKTSVALASNGVLTVTSLQTDWENDADDGFFLFKVITGDFDMSVQVVGPIDSRAHNFPGLMARAFGAAGAPAPDGRENYVIWGRFDEYNIANMLKSETAGAKRDRGLGTYPNTNYWLRIQRTGNDFKLFEKSTSEGDWTQVGSVTRTNFAGSVQVGIEHADYDGGRTLSARYKNFNLAASGIGPFAPPPPPVTNLKVEVAAAAPPEPSKRVISWTPAAGSAGSLVVVWTGSPVLKEVPADGTVYLGNPDPFSTQQLNPASWLPGQFHFIAYSGPGSSVTSSYNPKEPMHYAVFSYVGEGKTITYSRTPARSDP